MGVRYVIAERKVRPSMGLGWAVRLKIRLSSKIFLEENPDVKARLSVNGCYYENVEGRVGAGGPGKRSSLPDLKGKQ